MASVVHAVFLHSKLALQNRKRVYQVSEIRVPSAYHSFFKCDVAEHRGCASRGEIEEKWEAIRGQKDAQTLDGVNDDVGIHAGLGKKNASVQNVA